MYEKDRRIVITLDAGGTNFVFGAVQGDRFVVEPITLPSNSDRLDRCLETMVEGFRTVISRLPVSAFRPSSTTTATSTPTAKRWRVHCPKSTPGSKPQEAPNASAT